MSNEDNHMNREHTDYPHTAQGAPDYGMFTITIPRGASLKAENGAMAWMNPSISMKSTMSGGIKRMLSGEKLFINTFTADRQDADIALAPATPGDVAHIYLEDETVYLQNGSYLASSPEIALDIDFQGFKGFFSGEKLFMISCTGTGDLWFNTFGGLLEIPVSGNYVVDTGHIVGFTGGLSYTVHPVGGLKSLFLSGEGLVCRFSGSGTLWVQTRTPQAFITWADGYRRIESKKEK